ncbi:hypothetical protein LTR33_007376 [Friedmanniomyces endolithicus]|nr:hypothetical protein LTR33_007376 [Friedmanniomyces endolithicus]
MSFFGESFSDDDFDPRYGMHRASPRRGFMDPPSRRPMALDPMDNYGIDDEGPFSNALYDEMEREHYYNSPSPPGYGYDHAHRSGAPSPETPRQRGFDGSFAGPGFDLENGMLEYDEYVGQRPGDNRSDRLQGVWTEEFRERRPLLYEGFPGGSVPTAGRGPWPRGRSWPGWNESMPPGAVGYVGRDEALFWGHEEYGGPRMYPADMVDDQFIAAREADPDWSPSFNYM